jgi:hypothetical protein
MRLSCRIRLRRFRPCRGCSGSTGFRAYSEVAHCWSCRSRRRSERHFGFENILIHHEPCCPTVHRAGLLQLSPCLPVVRDSSFVSGLRGRAAQRLCHSRIFVDLSIATVHADPARFRLPRRQRRQPVLLRIVLRAVLASPAAPMLLQLTL